MYKIAVAIGVLCLALAIIVFILADGLRRYYSGIFFVIIGTVLLLNSLHWRRDADK